jgi:hypothetical protein
LEQARKEVAAAGYIPTHEEVRKMTAKDTSSWSETIIAANYFFDSGALVELYRVRC